MAKIIKNIAQSADEIKNLRAQLQSISFEIAQGKIKDIHKPRSLRKQVARLLTKIHQEKYNA